MATKAPLLGAEKKGGHSKASIFYGADEYLEDFESNILQVQVAFTDSSSSKLKYSLHVSE